MTKKLLTFFFLIFPVCLSANSSWLVSTYYFYKTHLSFQNTNRYNETYSGMGAEVTYEALSFLSFSLAGEYGSLKGVKRDVESTLEAYFPDEKASRSLTEIKGKAQLFFYSSPENIFYGGLGFGKISLKEMEVNRVKYPGTDQSFTLWHAFLGDRFLLFPSVVFQIEVDFASDFAKIAPVFGGNKDFNHYFINLSMGIGALF